MKKYLKLKRIILITLLFTLNTQSFTAAENSSDTPSSNNSDPRPPIYRAIENGQYDIVQSMLEKDPDLHFQKDNNDHTLFHIAIRNKQPIIAQYIIKKYPDLLTQKNKKGWTPLHFAAKHGLEEIAHYIINKNSDIITQKNRSGCTPLHLAAACGYIDIVKYMLKKNPTSHNQKDAYGQTPLHMAAAFEHLTIVELMLRKCKSIDIRAKKSSGSNILNLTPANKKKELINLLKNHLLRIYEDNPNEPSIKCGICLRAATECSDCQDIGNPLDRINLAPCCLQVFCEHDLAQYIRLEKLACPYCRCPWKLP